MTTALDTLNPFRYRGYVYDEETGLYYLRSRYYNPEWGRFINADALLGQVGALLDHNLFAYCGNNPVMHTDEFGMSFAYMVKQAAAEWLAPSLAEIIGKISAAISGIALWTAISGAIAAPRPPDPQEALGKLIGSLEMLFLNSVLGEAARKAIARKYSERDNQYDSHHIIPKRHFFARLARELVGQQNINVKTEPRNQVLLSKRFHYYLHTYAYCGAINGVFYLVSIASKEEDLRDNYLYTMDIIGGLLIDFDEAINSMLP